MYTDEHKAELRRYLSIFGMPATGRVHREGWARGPQPLGRLFIYAQPRFVWSAYEWEYDYEYGPLGTSEGCARESSLRLVSHVGGQLIEEELAAMRR